MTLVTNNGTPHLTPQSSPIIAWGCESGKIPRFLSALRGPHFPEAQYGSGISISGGSGGGDGGSNGGGGGGGGGGDGGDGGGGGGSGGPVSPAP